MLSTPNNAPVLHARPRQQSCACGTSGSKLSLDAPAILPGEGFKRPLPLLIKMDAGSFKGAEELERLQHETAASVERYADLARRHGFTAEAASDVSHEIVGTIEELSNGLLERHPGAVLFGGQRAFRHETVWTRWLHNSAVYALQHLFCRRGVPFVIVPARV